MNYTKQTFVKGQTLKAAHLNHMEEGLKAISDVLDTSSPNCHLITDDNGNRVWAPLENNVILHKTVLEPTYDDPSSFYIYGAWAKLPVEGNVCTVNYNGIDYECEIVGIPGDMDIPDGVMFVMGNLEDTLEGVVGNPDAPFTIIGLYVPQQGILGLLYARDEAATVVLSITGDGVSAPVGSTTPINITIRSDGTVSVDMDFTKAWLLSATELQASILIHEMSTYKGATTTTVDTVSKVEAALNGGLPNVIVMRLRQPWIDTSDQNDIDHIRYITWHPGNALSVDTKKLSALPLMPQSTTAKYYLVHNGYGWVAESADNTRAVVSNTFVVTSSSALPSEGASTEIVMSATRAQIEEAVTNGKQVVLHVRPNGATKTAICMPLTYMKDGTIEFYIRTQKWLSFCATCSTATNRAVLEAVVD